MSHLKLNPIGSSCTMNRYAIGIKTVPFRNTVWALIRSRGSKHPKVQSQEFKRVAIYRTSNSEMEGCRDGNQGLVYILSSSLTLTSPSESLSASIIVNSCRAASSSSLVCSFGLRANQIVKQIAEAKTAPIEMITGLERQSSLVEEYIPKEVFGVREDDTERETKEGKYVTNGLFDAGNGSSFAVTNQILQDLISNQIKQPQRSTRDGKRSQHGPHGQVCPNKRDHTEGNT